MYNLYFDPITEFCWKDKFDDLLIIRKTNLVLLIQNILYLNLLKSFIAFIWKNHTSLSKFINHSKWFQLFELKCGKRSNDRQIIVKSQYKKNIIFQLRKKCFQKVKKIYIIELFANFANIKKNDKERLKKSLKTYF